VNNLMRGLAGDDMMRGWSGNDCIVGGPGRDRINGGSAHDTLLGGPDRDILKGGRGDDTLEGGTETDSIFGDAGNDFLRINAGDVPAGNNESLHGGLGIDTLELRNGIGVNDCTGTPPGVIICTDPITGGTYAIKEIEFILPAQMNKQHALWVFSSSNIKDATLRNDLIQRSANAAVDTLYPSVYQSPSLRPDGRLMFTNDILTDMITQAHNANMEVLAAYGSPDWPALGCNPNGFPLQRMQEIIDYNTENPTAAFDGVSLDIEPPGPRTAGNYAALLTLYRCMLDTLKPQGLKVAVAIRFYWNDLVAFPAGGPVKPAYQHIIDMNFDNVVVMGYRDTAGFACPNNGIICLDQDEIAYADTRGKAGLILVGFETKNCVPGCGPERVTFFEETQEMFEQEMRLVARHFAKNISFGGFAAHNYKDTYLDGKSGLPVDIVGSGAP
jgi:hypothetical protein